VIEENEWNVKGRYNTAVKYDEDVKWIKEGNDYILPLCHVSQYALVECSSNITIF
jgi:hypothetical protein